MGELLAIAAAVGFASNYVIAKRALQSGTVLGGVIVGVGGAWIVLTVGALASLPHHVSASGIALFVAAGVIASGVGTWASISGIHLLGPSTSVPIEVGTRPLVAVAMAGIFLSESVTGRQLLGIAAVVAGGSVLSRAVAAASSPSGGGGPDDNPTPRVAQPALLVGLFPVLAGACYAVGDVLSKVGLQHMHDAQFGAMINMGAALAFWLAFTASVPSLRRVVSFRAAPLFLLGGCFLGGALLALYRALDVTEVSVVAPIIATQPLVILALSLLILRDIERIRAATVVGAGLVVIGAVLLVA